MNVDPRMALDHFVAALETHFAAMQGRRADDDPAVDAAYAKLVEAFDRYDEAIFTAFDEPLPFAVLEEDDDFDVDDDDDDEDVEDVDFINLHDEDEAAGAGPRA